MCILIMIRIREVLQADMPEIAVTQCHATMSIPGMYFKVTLWHHIMLPPPPSLVFVPTVPRSSQEREVTYHCRPLCFSICDVHH